MSSSAQNPRKIRFAEFELDLETAELRRNGQTTIVPGQPFKVLVTLLSRPGQLVTRSELKNQLWPTDTFVDFDQSLNKAVNRLRESLNDPAEHPRFIETLPRKGYRFIGEVGNGAGADTTTSANLIAASPQPTADAEVSGQGYAAETIRGHPAHSYSVNKVLASAITLGMAAIIAGVLFERFWVPHSPDLASIHIAKLTDSGMARDVAISPDGRYVVYSLTDGEEESLRLRQVATGSDVQILPSGPSFHGLTFSPDGSYIYFVRSDGNNPFFKYLYSTPFLGGAAQKLATDVDSAVSFSPDGQQFVYERCTRGGLELKVVNAAGTSERLLTTIHNASCCLFQPGLNWSPDGRTIAVSAWLMSKPERWVLDIVSVENSSVRELFSGPEELDRPVWLHHGDTLLVPRYDPRYHRSQLWTISFPAGEARRFTNDLTEYGGSLDITHDQGTAATVVGAIVSNVWVAPADDLSRGRQVTAGTLPMLSVSENSDGKILTVSEDDKVWAMNFDGSQRTSFGEVHDAGWVTACGQRFVVFLSYQSGLPVLTRVDADGSHAMHLADGHLWSPACSPDGRFAFYVNFDKLPPRAWRVSLQGGTPEEITELLGGIPGRLSVSPDGKFLAYPYGRPDRTGRPARHLAVVASTGGPPVKTFDVPGETLGVSWSTDGKGLQYLLTRSGATNIWEQPLAGGEPKQLTKFTSGRIFDFNWSSDHQQLLLTRADETSDVVLLSNLR